MKRLIVSLLAALPAVVSLSGCGGTTSSPLGAPSASAPLASRHGSAWQVVLTAAGEITGVALDGKGNLYLAELSDDRIQKFSLSGKMLAQWGEPGSGPGQLDGPAKLAVDAQGNVYVTEKGNDRVQKFSPDGKPLAQWGITGTGPGQFNFPAGIALDRQGNIYVAEIRGNRVQKLSPLGRPLAQWGTAGSGPGQFNVAYDVTLDASGNFYVSDPTPPWSPGNDRIQKFSPAGEPLAQWGRHGSGPGEFRLPTGVAVDSGGNIYVVDTGNNRIQKLSPTGQYLAEWPGPGGDIGQFYVHSEMAMDGQGNLYVSDRNLILKLVVR